MTARRKFLYATITVGLVFSMIEGTARFIWWRLEIPVFEEHKAKGAEMLRNDTVNFVKMVDGRYGYTLKPGNYTEFLTISKQGFFQREEIPVKRRPGYLRIVCLGESTTFGNSIESNYPDSLRKILPRVGRGYQGYEVINGGVPGWVSDQVALRVKYEIAQYKPDVAILYVGWNDFQSYDPLGPPNPTSYFDQAYGGSMWKEESFGWLKSVELASAWFHSGRQLPKTPAPANGSAAVNTPELNYRFLLESLDRLVSDLRKENQKVRVFVCTLVGRWPQVKREEYTTFPGVWWMPVHKLDPQTIVPYVHAFNEQLRNFARTRQLDLLDMEAEFQHLDRMKLQYDFAHMITEGYELMAWKMIDALKKAGIVEVSGDQRKDELTAKYALTPAQIESSKQ